MEKNKPTGPIESALELLIKKLLRVKNYDAIKLGQQIAREIEQEQFPSARESCERLAEIVRTKVTMENEFKGHAMRAITQMGFAIRSKYMKTKDMQIGSYVDAKLGYIPLISRGRKTTKTVPGFVVHDEKGRFYSCYVHYPLTIRKGEEMKLMITNVWGTDCILHLEPRVESGDVLFVLLKRKGRRGDHLFSFMSYDGFAKPTDCSGAIIPYQPYKVQVNSVKIIPKKQREKYSIPRTANIFVYVIEPVERAQYEECMFDIIRAQDK